MGKPYSNIEQINPDEAIRRRNFLNYGVGRPLSSQSIQKLCYPFRNVKGFRPRGTTQLPVGITYLPGQALRPEADAYHPPLTALEVISEAVKTTRNLRESARRSIDDLPLRSLKVKAPKKGKDDCFLVARIGDVSPVNTIIQGLVLDERVAITDKLVPEQAPKSSLELEEIYYDVSLARLPFDSRNVVRGIISSLPDNLSSLQVQVEAVKPITI